MSDLDLGYLDCVDWKKFPRNVDGVLKISQVTKDRVSAYLSAQAADATDRELIEIIELRCGFESFTAATAIGYGFDEFTRQRLFCCLSRLMRFKKIERQGKKGRYAYRLLAKPVVAMSEKPLNIKRSALTSIKSAENAARYA